MPEAIHFEAKFYALRKSKDGLIVSFVIHPNDAPNELITAPIGEQYIVALAPYVETPVPVVEATTERNEGSQSGRSLGRERYAAMSEGDKAVARAGMLADEQGFGQWLCDSQGFPRSSPEHAASFIREYCGVASRSQIATNPEALRLFLALETEYLMATGKMASPS